MGGTSNPSEEQLALVTARVIEIASAISETAASLDGSGYFEDSGFDDEERGAALSARLLEYCGSVEELDPNIDDHPQPRRMARYLLENVEFEVLQAPLPSALLTIPKEVADASEGAGLCSQRASNSARRSPSSRCSLFWRCTEMPLPPSRRVVL